MSVDETGLVGAIEDFRRARFRAKVERVLARLTGESADLLEYEEVRKKLGARGQLSRGLQNIPIENIVGSVGRYADFTRSFLPRQDDDERRWAGVKVAMEGFSGVPAIEVYQIGDAYFVLDGNHRVSVARQNGATHIQAYVTEIESRVPLSADVQPEDLVLKAEYAEFLERTRLDRARPDADLSVSLPGQYRKLQEHISVHQYFMGLDQKREVPYQEAVVHWYDMVYVPVVNVIREQGIMRDFPGRTETDLYLWVLEHRAELGQELHWEIDPGKAAQDLVNRYSPMPGRVAARVGERLSHAVVPQAIVAGPPPGMWREEVVRRSDRLFIDVLAAVTGTENGWYAVEQALSVAAREEGRLIGLHVVSSEAERKSQATEALEAEFKVRCDAAGVQGRWIVEEGSVSAAICEWSRWSNLTVVGLVHPPKDQPLSRLGSGVRTLIQNCPVPILAVPPVPSGMRRALLAYDGSPKADEALFVSTYLAGHWAIPLIVATVVEPERTTSQTLDRARSYLEEHGVSAEYVQATGDVGAQGEIGQMIQRAAREHDCELIVMGGYGFSPVLQIVLGSAVDQVLRASQHPVLICR
jgi:nucleotide-binding universal stress UspA family protein